MSVFDQRGQEVSYQYNAAGDINFGNVQNAVDIAQELEKLQQEVAAAAESGALDAETAIDAESNLKKAALQAKKENPDKKTLLGYLEQTRKILQEVVSVTGLVKGLSDAIKVVGMVL